jgi:aarF domain-containing kinase
MSLQPTLAEILAALPESFERDAAPEPELSDLASTLADRPTPTGRFRRMSALGTLHGKIAAAYLAWWLRTLPSSAEQRRTSLKETHLRNALRILGTMGYLRGAVMKVGQVIAAWPNVVPDEFSALLGRLHFQAPPMHYSLVREMLEVELGREPEEVFDRFETEAFAAASFGQVHRAWATDGGRLAVKVQYPNIAATIRSDLANLRTAALPMRLSADWENLIEQLDDIRRMLEQETDYVREAVFTCAARMLFEDEDDIVVPLVHDETSTKRVLTMDFVDGVHLDEYLARSPSQVERDRFGELIVRSSMRLYYRKHLLYADPQPGNYVFQPDGRLGLIDFGCCLTFDDAQWEYVSDVERASFARDDDWIERSLARAADLTPRQEGQPDRMRLLRAYCDWLWRPLEQVGPFDFGDPAYFREGVALFGELIKRGYTRSLPVNNWLGRCFYGLRALLTRLSARVDYRQIMEEETTVSRA